MPEAIEAYAVQRRLFALNHRRTLVAATTGRLIGMQYYAETAERLEYHVHAHLDQRHAHGAAPLGHVAVVEVADVGILERAPAGEQDPPLSGRGGWLRRPW